MHWLEQCATWCCGGWQNGSPLFSRLADAGKRLFSNAIQSDAQATEFHRELITKLWTSRDGTLSLLEWLTDFRDRLLDPLGAECYDLADELTILADFIERISPEGDSHHMCLANLAGQSEGRDSLNLSSLHSAKGREFPVVFIFGADVGRLPRDGSTDQDVAEARRVFYVGLTRAEVEIHVVYTQGRESQFVREVQRRIENGF